LAAVVGLGTSTAPLLAVLAVHMAAAAVVVVVLLLHRVVQAAVVVERQLNTLPA
jgi:hypothetical protein